MTCYIDDTDAFVYSKTETPDANMLVGLIIPENEKIPLIQILEGIKSKYNFKGKPIKYTNRGAVEKYYHETIRRPDLHKSLLFHQNQIKEEIIKKTSGIPFYIVISWQICPGKTTYKNERNGNLGTNFLEILNMSMEYLPKYKDESFEIVLDRFQKGNQESILESTYANWKESELKRRLKKTPSLYHYGVTCQNELLQLTDIIAGTFRTLIQCSINDKPIRSFNYTHLVPKLAGYPDNIKGAGLHGPSQYHDKIINVMMEPTPLSILHPLPQLLQ